MFSKVLAHAKKQMPTCLIISTIIWVINIVSDWDGRITPVSWLLGIVLTAVTVYVIAFAALGMLKLLWSLLKGIDK